MAIDDRRILGWREWVSLPDLGITAIKAKLDTGARTSALHAWNVEPFDADGESWVRFRTFPLEGTGAVRSEVPLAGWRWVMNSGGTRERRCVISTRLTIAGETWPIELTLANRDPMGFRMLIGREAMRNRFIVDPRRSYRSGRYVDVHKTREGNLNAL